MFVCFAAGAVMPLPVRGQAAANIPEPDITYFGNIPAGSQISISHPSGLLDSATTSAAEPYVLIVKLVQPVVTPTPAVPPAGTGYVGDMATVLVNSVAQGRVKLEERGAIYRLDIPNPATVPSPNALLSPVRVVPGIPSPGPTGTPTPTSTGATQTPTATRTPVLSNCAGDCDGNRTITLGELLKSVDVALGNFGTDQCMPTDRNNDGSVSAEELVTAVLNAPNSCPQGSQ